MRAQAREQHAQAERLGDVVVGAGIEAEDGVGVGVGAGQHDDRHLDAVAAHEPAGLAPVHVGQADVEQDGVVIVALEAFERGVRRSRRPATSNSSCRRSCSVSGIAQLCVVIDDQDLLAVLHCCVLLRGARSDRPLADDRLPGRIIRLGAGKSRGQRPTGIGRRNTLWSSMLATSGLGALPEPEQTGAAIAPPTASLARLRIFGRGGPATRAGTARPRPAARGRPWLRAR